MPSEFDLIVIGAGPGGYVCAFRAQQLGLKVALIEKRATLGGTCLNIGCIPSKALLHSSEQYAWAKNHAAESGIKLGSVEADLPTILKRKDAVVAKLVGGVGLLAKARKIPVFTGTATFVSPSEIEVGAVALNGPVRLTAKHFVIATGSAPVELPFMKFDGETVVSSDHALNFPSVPKKLVVVGGGAIGLELGSVWSRLGSEVTVVEFLPKIVAAFDDDIVRAFTRSLQRQGLKIECNARVTGLRQSKIENLKSKMFAATLVAERDGQTLEFAADKVLVSVGRRPYTDGLGLEKAGVQLDEKKRVKVDDHLRTSVQNIWAIGDVVAGPMLAHKAEEDGVAVAEWIAGKAGHVNWDLVPSIVYTEPEVASIGLGEDAAKAAGRAIQVGKFNFAANGRAIAMDATDGFVKIIADAATDRILGAQILGYNAGEIISEVVTHMEYGGSAEDLGRTIHAHPTVSESLKEADSPSARAPSTRSDAVSPTGAASAGRSLQRSPVSSGPRRHDKLPVFSAAQVNREVISIKSDQRQSRILVAQHHQTGVGKIHHPTAITRRLGLHPGQLFRDKVAADNQPTLDLLIEIEHGRRSEPVSQQKGNFGHAALAGQPRPAQTRRGGCRPSVPWILAIPQSRDEPAVNDGARVHTGSCATAGFRHCPRIFQ